MKKIKFDARLKKSGIYMYDNLRETEDLSEGYSSDDDLG